MNRKRELAKNTLIIFIGKICTQFLSFFLLPLYTTLLNSSEYGIIDLIITYISLFVPLITLQIEQALFRYLIDVRENKKEQKQIFSNIIFIVIVQVLIFLVIFLIINLFINIKYKYYIIINVIVTIFSSLFLQAARGLGDNISYSVGSVISGGLTIILNVIFLVILNMGASSILLSSILANIFCAIFILFKDKLYKLISRKNIDKIQIRNLLKYSIPLVPNGIIWWIINVSDRTIISIFIGVAQNGIYAVSNKFSGALINLYNIFNISWTESAVLHLKDKDSTEFISSTIKEMFNIFSSICLIIIAYMPFVFPIIINNNYSEAYLYIPPLIIGTLFNIIVGLVSVVYVAKKLTKKITTTSLISGILNILINLVLIKHIGVWAASISTIIAFASMAIYRYFDVQKYIKISLDIKVIIKTTIMFIISITLYYSNNLILYILNAVIITIYALIINKTSLINLLKIFKNHKFHMNNLKK